MYFTQPYPSHKDLSEYSRYLNLKTNPDDENDVWVDPVTTTDFDDCLAGPASCANLYTGSVCPAGHTAMRAGLFASTYALFCCPE